jgi:hypothetical protein
MLEDSDDGDTSGDGEMRGPGSDGFGDPDRGGASVGLVADGVVDITELGRIDGSEMG